MPYWEGKRALTVVSAWMARDGTPDFALNEVEVTFEEYENGAHYDYVVDRLRDDGFEEPWVHFDENDMPRFLLPGVKSYLDLPASCTEPVALSQE